MKKLIQGAAFGLLLAASAARADAVADLRRFVEQVKSGEADYTQTVSAPNGGKQRVSRGHFEFQRPQRFRFEYAKPDEQLIVSDGKEVWLYDPELNQVTQRHYGDALGATPAALLAGVSLDKDFVLKALPDAEERNWVEATPRVKDGPFQSLKIGFKGGALSAVDILDAFGQRSRLEFQTVRVNPKLSSDRFKFTPPPGADLIRP